MSVVSYSVPPFNLDVSLDIDAVVTHNLLLTALQNPIPIGPTWIGVPNETVVSRCAIDSDLFHFVYGFMNGLIGDGEEGLISRDDCFCNIFRSLASMEKFSRNKHEDSTALTTRADRTDKYEGVSLVITEEKIQSLADATSDLRRKVRWIPHFSKLPFVFGVAIAGNQLEVFAINPNTELKSLFKADINSVFQRWNCIIVAINMARVIKSFAERKLIIPSNLRFDVWHDRNNKRIRLQLDCAEVEFRNKDAFDRMVKFYNAIAAVPFIEQMTEHNEDKKRVKLVPVGVNRKPDSHDELVTAIKNICNCLIELHLKKYFHCDVRWGNIICVLADWYLIDCEYACHSNETDILMTRSCTDIKKTHVKDASQPWNATFDLYQVGLLLKDDDVKGMVVSNTNLLELRDKLLSKQFTVANVKTLVSKL